MPIFHIWFATKSRKWLLVDEVQEAAKAVLADIAREKGLALLEHEAIVDHVHLLLELDDRAKLPRAMNDLKGISARRLFEMFPDIKLDAHTNHFWQEGYGSKIVSAQAIETTKRYIQTQWERLDNYEQSAKPRPSGRG
jgi:putative transposase